MKCGLYIFFMLYFSHSSKEVVFVQKKNRRRFGDRRDGWRVTNVDSFFFLIPQVMRTRIDSQVHFEDEIPLEPIEKFIRDHKEEMPTLSTMHVVAAAFVRMLSVKPCTNRFVVHNKIYAHKDICLSIAVKRTLSEDGEETTIKPKFDPMDTLRDVVRKIDQEVVNAEADQSQSNTDTAAKVLSKMPAWLLRIVIRFLFFLDNHGWLPDFLVDLSPWHTSAWLTNVGSLGIAPVYHHLYEFGTASVFAAMGKKRLVPGVDYDGNVQPKRKLGLKFVVDERICDGYYYAMALRSFSKLMSKPELLLEPPKERKYDPGVPKDRFM